MTMAGSRREILVLVVFKSDCRQFFEQITKYHFNTTVQRMLLIRTRNIALGSKDGVRDFNSAA